MRIVLIRSNPVRPDSRVEKEAYSLKKGGHDVTILCWDRDGDHAPAVESVCVSGICIPALRIGAKAEFGQGNKSMKSFIKFQIALTRWLIGHHKEYDVVHACDFDTCLLSYPVAKLFHKKFVFDIFDIFYDHPKSFFSKLMKRYELRIVKNSDATIICTEERIVQLCGITPKKLEVIHNSPFDELITDEECETSKKNNKVKVVYVGILQDYRLLKEIGNFFEKNPNIEWHVGGFGKYEDYFNDLSLRCKNVKFYGRLQYSDTLRLEKYGDILLAIYDPTIGNHKLAAPNKFYESLMLGKPVIMVKNTGMSQIVSDNDGGALIDYSEDGFAAGLSELIRRKSDWPEMGKRLRKVYDQEYSWANMENKLLNLYSNL